MSPQPRLPFVMLVADAAVVQRLQDNDPFFRARADRYVALEQSIRAIAAEDDNSLATIKCLRLLQKRRDALMHEMVGMIAAAQAEARGRAAVAAIWKATPAGWKWS